jgi:uncharacterized protein (TIGR00661 family)
MQLLDIHNKRILFGVLNWGLGHASRSSQLINQLLQQQNSVQIASSGEALAYLKDAFPQLTFHDLKSGEIIYPAHQQLWFKLLLQSGKIFAGIKNETEFVKNAIANDSQINLIISDNCYGFYSETIHSIFVTHQLNIKAPFFEKKIQGKIHALIKPFHEIWIPDLEGNASLSGALSHPVLLNKPCVFIGPISALKINSDNDIQPIYDYCAIISGPEKQRTIFENQVMKFLEKQFRPTVLIRGIVSKHTPKLKTQNSKLITVHDFKSGDGLLEIINQSKMVIARSGYSTIMDMYLLKKSCILIPTPGQTEQAYLFTRHFGKTSPKIEAVRPKLITPSTN